MPHFSFARQTTSSPYHCATRHSALLLLLVLIGAYAYGQQPTPAAHVQGTHATAMHDGHSYNVLYTVTESNSGKPVNVQHYAVVATANGRTAIVKVGHKNPVMTGGYLHEGDPVTTQFQFTYIDTGLNISAQIIENASRLQLTAKIEQSMIVEPVNPQTLKDPVVRQNVIDCSVFVRLGSTVMLGSYDVPESTRHYEIQAVLERLP